MTFKQSPSWLLQHSKLLEIVHHHLFLPANIPTVTSLPDASSFHRGLKQFLFWKSQLTPSLKKGTIFLAFLGPQGLVLPNVLQITSALKNVIDLGKIAEFYQGADNHFLAISFTSPECVAQIQSNFLFFNDTVVLHITSNESPQHRFRLLWLPPLFEESRVHHLLNKYTKTHRMRRESIPIADGRYSPTNVIAGFLTLSPGVSPESLPHLIQLPSPHKGCALLTIEARPPLCLKCKAIGHTRPKCPMIRCSSCNFVHFPSSTCGKSSYSSIASHNITPCTNDDWLLHISDDDPTVQESSPPSNQIPATKDSPSPTSLITSISSSSKHSTALLQSASNDVIHSSSLSHPECDRTCDVSPDDHSPLLPDIELSIHKSDFTPSTPIIDTFIHSSDPLSDTSTINTLSIPDENSLSINKSSHSFSNPVATFSRSKGVSKVHLSDFSSQPSSIARSHILNYSLHSKESAASAPVTTSSHSSDLVSTIFGDPDPDNYFSSDTDTPSEPSTSLPLDSMLTDDTLSRKRKVSTSSHDSFSLPPDSPSSLDDSTVNSFTLAASSVSSSMESLLPSSEPPPLSIQSPTSPLSLLRQQVITLFTASFDQVLLLEQACPDGCFTPDLIKAFRHLHDNGIRIHEIISDPQVLKLPLRSLKRKISSIRKILGTISIKDICNQSTIDLNFYSGNSVSPSGFFT